MMPQAETVQSPSNASVLSFDIELDGELTLLTVRTTLSLWEGLRMN